jgi:ketopantoate hydroxymethyltransferase
MKTINDDSKKIVKKNLQFLNEKKSKGNKRYDTFEERTLKAMQQFVSEVINNEFPTEQNSQHVGEHQLKEVKELIRRMDSG